MSERVPQADQLLHRDFPDMWELADGPNPELLSQYLGWINDDPERLKSAVDAMQWVGVGLNALHVAVERDNTGMVTRSLQLNFYHRGFPGNEDPHGHSRDATGTWYSGPNTRQVIKRWEVVPTPEPATWHTILPVIRSQPSNKQYIVPDFLSMDPEKLEERAVVANIIIDRGNGKRPGYVPIQANDSTLLRRLSTTHLTPLSSTEFLCHEVHSVGVEFGDDDEVAISIHEKRAEQPQGYSTLESLNRHKKLSRPDAEMVYRELEYIRGDLPPDERLGPVTMLYPPLDFDVLKMEFEPAHVDPNVAERLLKVGHETVRKMVKEPSLR